MKRDKNAPTPTVVYLHRIRATLQKEEAPLPRRKQAPHRKKAPAKAVRTPFDEQLAFRPLPADDAPINAIQKARAVLGERVRVVRGGYFLDDAPSGVLRVIEAANAVLARRGEPLIGKEHHRWRQ